MTTFPTVTLQYAPASDAAEFPWMIAVDGSPLVRISTEDRAVDTLQAVEHYAAAPSPEGAVGMALADTARGDDADEGTVPAEDTDLGRAPVVTLQHLSGSDTSQHMRWVLAVDGTPIFRLTDGEHAAQTLQDVEQHPDAGDVREVIRQALQRTSVFTFDRIEEINL